MTLTQLQYVVAIDTWRHFARAAEHSFVSQPTLSMQVRKLEEELGLPLFDRARTPVVPTDDGREIIAQARTVLREAERMRVLAQEKLGSPTGTLAVGIIPTLAPYLLPRFLGGFMSRYPSIRLVVSELTTDVIIERLRENRLDAGLLATPLQAPGIAERHLFYEEYVVYISPDESAFRKRYLLADDIDTRRLWLLEEGHCMRSQIMRLCELKKAGALMSNFQYEAGSVETLKRMVETRHGVTIIPALAMEELTARQAKMVRRFKPPVPAREVSLVTHRTVVKKRLLDALQAEILRSVPRAMLTSQGKDVLKLGDGEA